MRRALLMMSLAALFGCGGAPTPTLGADLGPAPTLAAPTPFTPPVPTVLTVPRLPPVWLVPRHDLPLVAVSVVVPYGSAADPEGQAGLAALTAEMMEQGAGSRGALALSREADRLGASLSVTASRDYSVARLVVLRDRLEPALALLGDVVSRPRFEADEWTRSHRLWVAGLRSRAFEPRDVASVVAQSAFFGAAHPYGHPVDGWLRTVEPLTLDPVKAFHRRHWSPAEARVVVVGDVDAEALGSMLPEAFTWWVAGDPPPPVTAPPAVPAPAIQTVLVARPAAEQTMLLVVAPGPAASDPAATTLELVNIPLGAGFTSRLNQNLREDKGYTYGARSRVSGDRGPGYLSAAAAVQQKFTGPALKELLAECAKMAAEGPAAAELAKAQASARASDVEAYEAIDATADRLAHLAGVGLPPDFDAQTAAARAAVDLAQAKAAAASMGLGRGLVIAVGDPAVVRAAFAELGLPAPEVRDPEGQPVTDK